MDEAARSGTEVAIMEATYEALSTHGYADLTIQRIADAFPKSKSLLYYHYDDKEAILQAFLDWLIDEFRADFEARLDGDAASDPQAAFDVLLDQLLPRDFDDEERTFRTAVLALQARAPHDSEYAARFADLFDVIEAALVAVIERGVEAGAFHEVDPQQTARLVLAVASGGVTWALSAETSVTGVRDALDAFVASELYR
ncbi:TetR/AcrR family transcriptional regulator [Halorarius litoreus]|uniref:TetR/AcrR family transcriptional regulator n=1 Tax=Halorarius litoreus TaxID=2962676 RepID=UPI0020CED4A8|nr:TetR/AcrR family transcriptional regulator [Halorarius litoreus]